MVLLNLYDKYQEKTKESLKLSSELTLYISNFFLEDNMSVYVKLDHSPVVIISYKPQRNKCYVMQKEAFYKKVDDLCEDLGLVVGHKESRGWDSCIDGFPFFHQEIVHIYK